MTINRGNMVGRLNLNGPSKSDYQGFILVSLVGRNNSVRQTTGMILGARNLSLTDLSC